MVINTTSFSQSSYELTTNARSKIGKPGKMQPYILQSHPKNSSQKTTVIPQLIANINKQRSHNINKTQGHPKFITPVKQKEGAMNPGFYSITSYFDHDSLFPDLLTDYNCGNLTYDLSTGNNHEGTDYFLWPFPWQKMANDEVEIVAAAPGNIYYKQDGFFDQSCGENTDNWNGLGISHLDGSISWYIHMKKNSLTNKPVGMEVEQGEYLGIVGSSGQSDSPHLHFEVYNSDGLLIDPFEGPCNNSVTESWWHNQESYKQSAINRLATNSKLPEFPECPKEEIPNESNSFYPNDSIWLLSYYQNVFLVILSLYPYSDLVDYYIQAGFGFLQMNFLRLPGYGSLLF